MVRWPEKQFALRQETQFPESEQTALTVTDPGSGEIAVRLRVPGWLRSAPVVTLNGKVLDASAAPGSYLTIARSWRQGDRIEMPLKMHLDVAAMPDDPHQQAFLYGPLVLAGDLGAEGLTDAHISGPNLRVGWADVEQHGSPLGPTNRTPPIPSIEIPRFRAVSSDLTSWIVPAGQPHTFRTSGQKKDVTLLPLYKLFDRRYAVYWQVT